MKSTRYSLLGIAVAAALGAATPQVHAAVYATENKAAILTNGLFSVTTNDPTTSFMPVPTDYTVGGVNYMYATVAITGGAKFKNPTALNLFCHAKSAGAGSGVVLAAGQQSANSTAIFFAFNTGQVIRAMTSCYLGSGIDPTTATNVELTMGGSNSSKNLTFQSYRKVGPSENVAYPTSPSSKTLVSFARAHTLVVNPGSADAIIDVKQGSLKLTNAAGGTANQSAALAMVGYVMYQDVSATTPLLMTSTAGTTVNSNVGYMVSGAGMSVTIKGQPIAGAKNVFLSTDSACAAPITGGSATSPTSASVTLGPVFKDPTDNATVVSAFVCVKFNGTSPISAGTLEASATSTGGYTYDFSTSGLLWELKKNGQSFKLFNLNLPTTFGGSSAEVTNVRIYNTGGNSGAVRATVYNDVGGQVGTAAAIVATSTDFGPKVSKVLKMEDIFTAAGITTYAGGRPWIMLEGEVSDMEVQVVTRNKATGVVVNMSPVSTNYNK